MPIIESVGASPPAVARLIGPPACAFLVGKEARCVDRLLDNRCWLRASRSANPRGLKRLPPGASGRGMQPRTCRPRGPTVAEPGARLFRRPRGRRLQTRRRDRRGRAGPCRGPHRQTVQRRVTKPRREPLPGLDSREMAKQPAELSPVREAAARTAAVSTRSSRPSTSGCSGKFAATAGRRQSLAGRRRHPHAGPQPQFMNSGGYYPRSGRAGVAVMRISGRHRRRLQRIGSANRRFASASRCLVN